MLVAVGNITGCAAVCNPQGPGAANSSGNPIGLTVALVQIGVCAGYYAVATSSTTKKYESEKFVMPEYSDEYKAREKAAREAEKGNGILGF